MNSGNRKINCHCKLDLESSTQAVTKRSQAAWTSPMDGPQVQDAHCQVHGPQDLGISATSLPLWERLGGFTLIEILVVVIIIAVLAAIAVAQYQKSVEKSKALEGLAVLKSLAAAQQRYYLEHGTYADKFQKLDVVIPWTGNTKFLTVTAVDTISNKDWSAQIEEWKGSRALYVARISGKYKGAGFCGIGGLYYCFERKSGGGNTTMTIAEEGAFCRKIMGISSAPTGDQYTRMYKM